MTTENLVANAAHASMKNRDSLKKDNRCACYYCLARLTFDDIENYWDDGKTATCPHCGMDSVIPDPIDNPISYKTLNKMYRYWFGAN